MGNPTYEKIHELNEMGLNLAFRTRPGGYYPPHWHEVMEIIFPLNGDAVINIEGAEHPLYKRQATVVAPRQVHSTRCSSTVGMFLSVHISESMLEKYLPDIELYRIRCYADEVTDEQRPAYDEICEKLDEVIRLYIGNPAAADMESEGIILQVLALLIRHFSVKTADIPLNQVDALTRERLIELITWVDEHYSEPLSTIDAADLLGLSVEYFCRFFKKNMNTTFLQYVNEVRATHVYHDLTETDLSVADIAEQNGFTNQKLFNRVFKTIYGRTPSAVRASGETLPQKF